jgi:2-keto-4-pentenoate hydratase
MTSRAALTEPRLDRASVERHALSLRQAYEQVRPIPPLRHELADATIEDAYAIQVENTTFWRQAGRSVVGAKIGLTAKSVQRQLGVDQPDFGVLFADMVVLDGGEVEPGRLLQPKVEGEIAFVLGRTPDAARLTPAELISSIDYVLPAIEIVDSRIANWDISVVDTVADNASSGLFVLGGRPVSLRDIDLRLCGMVLEKNGEGVSFGAGAACLGSPLNAFAWLARRLADLGPPLQAGDVVLTGALGPMVAVAPGDVVEVRIQGVGTVKVSFAND